MKTIRIALFFTAFLTACDPDIDSIFKSESAPVTNVYIDNSRDVDTLISKMLEKDRVIVQSHAETEKEIKKIHRNVEAVKAKQSFSDEQRAALNNIKNVHTTEEKVLKEKHESIDKYISERTQEFIDLINNKIRKIS